MALELNQLTYLDDSDDIVTKKEGISSPAWTLLWRMPQGLDTWLQSHALFDLTSGHLFRKLSSEHIPFL